MLPMTQNSTHRIHESYWYDLLKLCQDANNPEEEDREYLKAMRTGHLTKVCKGVRGELRMRQGGG